MVYTLSTLKGSSCNPNVGQKPSWTKALQDKIPPDKSPLDISPPMKMNTRTKALPVKICYLYFHIII